MDLPMNQPRQKMAINEGMMDELLKHDFQSKMRGKKRHNKALMEKQPKKNKRPRQDQGMTDQSQQQYNDAQSRQSNGYSQKSDLMPPKGGDMRIWLSKLTPAQRAAYQRGIDSYKSELQRANSVRSDRLSNINENEFEDFENAEDD